MKKKTNDEIEQLKKENKELMVNLEDANNDYINLYKKFELLLSNMKSEEKLSSKYIDKNKEYINKIDELKREKNKLK